jgi:hypothetical protein
MNKAKWATNDAGIPDAVSTPAGMLTGAAPDDIPKAFAMSDEQRAVIVDIILNMMILKINPYNNNFKCEPFGPKVNNIGRYRALPLYFEMPTFMGIASALFAKKQISSTITSNFKPLLT